MPYVETFEGEYGTISSWPVTREALGLNPSGTAVNGVTVLDEIENEHGTYEAVVLQFEDTEAMERARDRLHEESTELAKYGDHKGSERLQSFAGRISDVYIKHEYDN
jgi:hypothetical protein